MWYCIITEYYNIIEIGMNNLSYMFVNDHKLSILVGLYNNLIYIQGPQYHLVLLLFSNLLLNYYTQTLCTSDYWVI